MTSPQLVEVWLGIVTDGVRAEDWELLDDHERARADRFVRSTTRSQFVAAHAAVRTVLGRRLGTEPGRLRFRQGPCVHCGEAHGKPTLAGAQADALHFSLSHSREAIAVATAEVPVGIDIEGARDMPALDMAARFFSPVEVEHITRSNSPVQEFLRLWTRKEALLKATGEGIVGGLSTTALDPVGDGRANLTVLRRGFRWAIADVGAPPGYSAAVAGRSSTIEVRVSS